jgi:hypothetical protein
MSVFPRVSKIPTLHVHGRDCTVGGFTTTYVHVISAYHNYGDEFESRSWRGVFDTALCDKVCQ